MQVAPPGPVGLVGRRSELATISAAAKVAAGYRPSGAWIEGDAGWGKTSFNLLGQLVCQASAGRSGDLPCRQTSGKREDLAPEPLD